MRPRGLAANSHPASAMLHSFHDNGCPTDCGNDWSHDQIVSAIKRGPHISAKDPQAAKYLHEQTQEKVTSGFAKIVKWGDIKTNYPKNMKISPVAMIPHKSRDYRCILDLSFQYNFKNTKQQSVNQTTNTKAPKKSMAYLGMVLKKLIYTMSQNYNQNMPFMYSKNDIKDGFWRMNVSKNDAWNFCYVLPSLNKQQSLDDVEIVVPHVLQMGWCKSPLTFLQHLKQQEISYNSMSIIHP